MAALSITKNGPSPLEPCFAGLIQNNQLKHLKSEEMEKRKNEPEKEVSTRFLE